MKPGLFLGGALLALTLTSAAHAQAAKPVAPPVERREMGNQILENVPVAPPSIGEALRRYQNVRSAAFQDWLPDGSMLIATRFAQTAQLHRVASPGADRAQITFFDEPVSAAAAIPGSDRFVFIKDVGGDEWFQLYSQGLTGPETLLTQPGTRNGAASFSHDGKLMVWDRKAKGSADTELLIGETAGTTPPRLVAKLEGSVSPLDIAPDGKTALIGRYVSVNESQRWLIDLATGARTPVGVGKTRIAYGGGRFTADGKAVILASDEDAEAPRLARIDLATGARTWLTPAQPWGVEAFDLSKDGRILAYTTNEDGYSRLFLRDLATGRDLPTPALPDGVIMGPKLNPAGDRLGFTLTTPTSNGDAWSLDLADGKLQRWTASELGGLDPADLVKPTLVRFKSFDGRSIPAFVYRPKGATGKLPVIIDIHGGPEGQSLPSFSAATQYRLAQIGAVVIQPNVRGSTGYGKTYLDLDNGPRREDSVKDIGALLDWIATQPDLDAGHVAVMGGSYGGYMSLAAMTHYSDRLAGGVEAFGISNFVSFLQTTEAYRRDLRRVEYGDERDPAMLKVFQRISPLNNVGKIGKPMLVLQGWNDPRVPKSESDQVVARLREQGIETWYVQFKDEGHGFRKKPNADRQREVETQFLRKILGLDR
jgi:dipeptidyl aminopeptidase/acylaminoacyl peptidase